MILQYCMERGISGQIRQKRILVFAIWEINRHRRNKREWNQIEAHTNPKAVGNNHPQDADMIIVRAMICDSSCHLSREQT